MTNPPLVPLLVVRGAARAIDFYERAFGARVLARYEHGPERRLSHADLALGAATFSLTEEARAWHSHAPESLGGSPVVLQLGVDDAEAVLAALQRAGASVLQPLQEWLGERMARVRDPFGHVWLLRERIEELTVDEIQRRRDELFERALSRTSSEAAASEATTSATTTFEATTFEATTFEATTFEATTFEATTFKSKFETAAPTDTEATLISGTLTSGTLTSGTLTSGTPTSGTPTSGTPTSGTPTSGTPTSGACDEPLKNAASLRQTTSALQEPNVSIHRGPVVRGPVVHCGPVVHLVLGPVGAGKSTFAIELARAQEAVRFTLDEWMAVLFRPDRPETGLQAWYVERAARCVEQIWALASSLCYAGRSVVLEIGLLERAARERFYARAAAAGLPLALYVLDAPRELRRLRVAERNRVRGPTFSALVTPEIFELASDLWEPLAGSECEGREVCFLATGLGG